MKKTVTAMEATCTPQGSLCVQQGCGTSVGKGQQPGDAGILSFVKKVARMVARPAWYLTSAGIDAHLDRPRKISELKLAKNQVVASAVSNILRVLSSLPATSTGARIFLYWSHGQSQSNTLCAMLKHPDEVAFGNCQLIAAFPVELNAVISFHFSLKGSDSWGQDIEFLIPCLTAGIQQRIAGMLLDRNYMCTFEDSIERGHSIPSVRITW